LTEKRSGVRAAELRKIRAAELRKNRAAERRKVSEAEGQWSCERSAKLRVHNLAHYGVLKQETGAILKIVFWDIFELVELIFYDPNRPRKHRTVRPRNQGQLPLFLEEVEP